MTEGYCYLIVTIYDYLKNINNAYTVAKIGRTTREFGKRMKEYDLQSIYMHVFSHDCKTFEKEIMRNFKKKFELDHGYEYFRGDI